MPSRRSLLATLGAVVAAPTAGCTGLAPGDVDATPRTRTDTRTPTRDSDPTVAPDLTRARGDPTRVERVFEKSDGYRYNPDTQTVAYVVQYREMAGGTAEPVYRRVPFEEWANRQAVWLGSEAAVEATRRRLRATGTAGTTGATETTTETPGPAGKRPATPTPSGTTTPDGLTVDARPDVGAIVLDFEAAAPAPPFSTVVDVAPKRVDAVVGLASAVVATGVPVWVAPRGDVAGDG